MDQIKTSLDDLCGYEASGWYLNLITNSKLYEDEAIYEIYKDDESEIINE
mgnify:CR=1 FL=1